VVEFMRKEGRSEWVGKGDGTGSVFWVWWRNPEEWAGLIADWVDETAQKNTVLTLYELTERKLQYLKTSTEWILSCCRKL